MGKRRRTREGEMTEQPTIRKAKQDLDLHSNSERKRAKRGVERKRQLESGMNGRTVEAAIDESATVTNDGESVSRVKNLPPAWVAELMPGITALLGSYHDLDTSRLAAFSGQLLSLAFEGWQKHSLSVDPCPVERDEQKLRTIGGGQDETSGTNDLSTIQRQLEIFRTELSNMKLEQSRQQQKFYNMTGSQSKEAEIGNTNKSLSQLEKFKTDLAKLKLEQGHQQQQQQLLSMALQSDTTSLRQEIDMTRVQREQQRHWNKNVLKEQAEGFQKEINLLTEQLKDQKAQEKDIQELRAEMAELRAGNLRGRTQSPGPMSGPAHPHDEPTNLVLGESTGVAKEAELIEKSITARQAQWTHFLSQEGNYMYAPNLENGLRDVVRDIRKFNIRHAHSGEVAFDMIMFAIVCLCKFTIEGKDSAQDFHSVPLKLEAWRHMDEFAHSLLKGMGWRYPDSKQALDLLQRHKEMLENGIQDRLPDLEFDSWFPLTTSGLVRCTERAVVG